MLRLIISCVALLGVHASVLAEERPLMCFGTEPFWSFDLGTPGQARFGTPDGEGPVFEGAATRLDWLGESLWRGADADGGVAVALLRDGDCSDNMSDTVHPVSARVSLPDGRFLAGCCRLLAADDSTAAAPASPLEGATWRLSALDGVEPATFAALSQPITLRFTEGIVEGFAGCNRFSGAYEVEGTQLVLGENASTMMACEEPAMAIEQAFHAAFSGTLDVSLDGDRLTLSSASGSTLALDREPPPQLAMTSWKVTGFNNGRQAVVGPQADSMITIGFEDGTIFGDSGCNRFNGSYTIDGERIEIGPLMSTRMACPEPLMAQEQQFLAALQSAVRWRIDGNVLDMHREDGERAIWSVRE